MVSHRVADNVWRLCEEKDRKGFREARSGSADVAILGRDAWKIRDAVHIGRRSYQVAKQSIVIGIGLSLIGMVFAFFGFIPPVYGAILQEVIDVVVIVNALRSTY